MGLSSGDRLGPYRIEAPLGAGGMGEVYRAHDTRLGRDVALKVLRERESVERFEREARAVAALSHPNILAIHDVGTDGGRAYVAMELLQGETLRERLTAGPLPLRKALEIGAEIARGLAAAHAAGIVHRDLKPDNVWITREGGVKILDFGLARSVVPAGMADKTRTDVTVPGTVLGTVAYMAPEQVRGEAAGPAADVFALGVVLYEMLSGRQPFRAATAPETMTAILREDPPPLEAVPPAVERVVRRCLEKRPAERFQSSGDLSFALATLSTSGSAPSLQAGPRWRGNRLVAIAALVVLACLTAVFLLGRELARRASADVALGTPSFTIRGLSLGPQIVFQARFAPDGRTVVFSGAREGNTPSVYVLRPEYPEAQRVGAPGQHLLSVSSKGELAVLTRPAFLTQRLFTGTLARTSLRGETPRDILEGVREADWAPDGERIAVIRETEGEDRLEFPPGKVLVRTAGYLSDLRISPQGDRIAYLDHPRKWDDAGAVWVVDLEGKARKLSGDFVTLQGLAWEPQGQALLFGGSRHGMAREVHEVSLTGEDRVRLQTLGGAFPLDVSADGQWLVDREDNRSAFVVMAPGATEERDLSWLTISANAHLSGDGRAFIFTEQDTSSGLGYVVRLRGTDGSAVVRLGEGFGADLSPDGKLALVVTQSSPPHLVVYPTSGMEETVSLPPGPVTAFESARWLRDGRRILLCGSEGQAPPRCYLQELPSGTPQPVTPPGTRDGWPAPDGSFVLARAQDGSFRLFSPGGGAGRPLPALTVEARVIRLSVDGKAVYFYRPVESPASVMRLDLASGHTTLVRTVGPRDLTGILNIYEIALADDDRCYLYTPWHITSSLFVVEPQGSASRLP